MLLILFSIDCIQTGKLNEDLYVLRIRVNMMPVLLGLILVVMSAEVKGVLAKVINTAPVPNPRLPATAPNEPTGI